jgi:phage gp36-like protein
MKAPSVTMPGGNYKQCWNKELQYAGMSDTTISVPRFPSCTCADLTAVTDQNQAPKRDQVQNFSCEAASVDAILAGRHTLCWEGLIAVLMGVAPSYRLCKRCGIVLAGELNGGRFAA